MESATLPLSGQKALVTGASSGIGEAVVGRIRHAGRRSLSHRADVSKEDEVRAMFRRVVEEFGTLDILVNNAGLQRDAPFDAMTLEQWQNVLAVNLTGQFLCAREALREFKRRSAGKIICISSVHEAIPEPRRRRGARRGVARLGCLGLRGRCYAFRGRRDAALSGLRFRGLTNSSQRRMAAGVNSASGWLPPMMNISRCSFFGSS